MEESKKLNLLLGITGSVAAIRFEEILENFYKLNKFNIKVIITEKGKIFLEKLIKITKKQKKIILIMMNLNYIKKMKIEFYILN